MQYREAISQWLQCFRNLKKLLKIPKELYVGYTSKYLQYWAPLVVQTVKNLPAMQETQVLPLGWEYPLEK